MVAACASQEVGKLDKRALIVSESLENPAYDTEVKIYGEVGLLGQLDCPCFELTSDGGICRYGMT